VSYCLTASCLAHRERMFWMSQWGIWVHGALKPCEAMEGEADPTELRCRYCGVRLEPDGAGRLWAHSHPGAGHWVMLPCGRHPEGCECVGRLKRWKDTSYREDCPISPTFHHEVTSMHFTGVKQTG
jgi:hypothetical protein